MAINYEAPFMFLLFGGACAVLIDTGATGSGSRAATNVGSTNRTA
jgi:hydroxyacylglutathione hydrolase